MAKITYDTHLHTEFSTDSHEAIENHIKKAQTLGMNGICITDHMDYCFPKDPTTMHLDEPFTFDFEAYKKELSQIKNNHPDFDLKIGVECGLQPYEEVIEKNRKLCSDPALDQIIGSVHLVSKKDPYYPAFWEGRTTFDSMQNYLEAILININLFSDFDILGHMDYAVRYAPTKGEYKPEKHFAITDAVFEFIIKNNIALEINTSALKGDYAEVNPHPVLLRRYYEKGGRMITFGSDAHAAEHLGYGFDTAAELAKEIGFSSYFTFSQRKPIEHSL
ncbi:MAG: histidinol-phosphatase HisJ family protein [Eubacterium sp.]|nr:histidinol-phosphatase HisJ family protein [Eubacterium sp.]